VNPFKKLDNAASMPFPLPRQAQPQQVHNHNAPNWALIIIVCFMVAILTIIFVWQGAIFLFDKLDSPNPEKAAATAIIGSIGLFVIVQLARFVAMQIITKIGDVIKDIISTVGDNRLQLAQAQQLTAIASLPAGRSTDAQHRFAQVVILVMNEAYTQLASGKPAGKSLPWSRNSAAELADSFSIDIPMQGSLSCDSIGPFLRRRGVITPTNQINFAGFPNIASISALLQKEFNLPINTLARLPAPTLVDGYMHIENAN